MATTKEITTGSGFFTIKHNGADTTIISVQMNNVTRLYKEPGKVYAVITETSFAGGLGNYVFDFKNGDVVSLNGVAVAGADADAKAVALINALLPLFATSGVVNVNVTLGTVDTNIQTLVNEELKVLQNPIVENAAVTNVAAVITGTSTPCKKAIATAAPDNTDYVMIGGSDLATKNGIPLYPTDTYEIEVANVNLLYAKAGSGTQKVSVLYYN